MFIKTKGCKLASSVTLKEPTYPDTGDCNESLVYRPVYQCGEKGVGGKRWSKFDAVTKQNLICVRLDNLSRRNFHLCIRYIQKPLSQSFVQNPRKTLLPRTRV